MKRFLHITLLLQLLLCTVAGTAVAQNATEIQYSSADGTLEHWYVIRFRRSTGYALKSNDSGNWLRSGTYSATSASDATDEFKWKFVESGTAGEYYMVSKDGKYVGFDNTRFTLVASEANAALLHIEHSTNANNTDAWEIFQMSVTDKSMNSHQGFGNDKEIHPFNKGDNGNALQIEFDQTTKPNVDFYLQFSSYGRWAMYDDGTAIKVQQPDDAHPTDAGYTWTRTKTDRGYTLKSGRGNYIAADGTLTINPAEAAIFTIQVNPYEGDVNDTGGHTVFRYLYTLGNKALTVDMESKTVALSDIPATPSRATVIRETTEIDGTEWASISTADNPIWYGIKFGNEYLTIGSNQAARVSAKPATFDPSLIWRLEASGQDLFVLKNYDKQHLAWDGTKFVAATDGTPATFRLAEYTEAGSNRDKWVLHYVGATTANQYLCPNFTKTQVGMTAANKLGEETNKRRCAALVFERQEPTQNFSQTTQPVYFSAGEDEYWYVIRFQEHKNLVMRCDDDMMRMGTYPADAPAADAPDNMKWKLEVSDKGEYFLISKTGKHIRYADGRFRSTTDKTTAARLHLIYNTKNRYPYAWQIQRWGAGCGGYNPDGFAMNPVGGHSEGKEIGENGTHDANNALLFDFAGGSDKGVFLQFSSYGRLALHDEGAGNAAKAVEYTDGAPTDGYLWTKSLNIDGGYTLQSDLGNYLALSADGTSWVTTTEKYEATSIFMKQNPYAESINEVGRRLVHRKMLYSGNRAIAINPADGTLALTDAATPSRATIINETPRVVDTPEQPVFSTDAAPIWYNIIFTRTGDMLNINYAATTVDKQACVGQSASSLNKSMLWRPEATDSNPDEFYLKNYNNEYLYWNGTMGVTRFAATTDKTQAAPFRLAEYIENGPDRDKWTLHYVGPQASSTYNQYVYAASDKASLHLNADTDNDRPFIIFKRVTLSQPDFCTEDGNDWRRIFFFDATDMNLDNILLTGETNAGAGAIQHNDRDLWKNIETTNGHFILKNWDGKYLSVDTDGNFTLTTDKAGATEFTLTESTPAGAPTATWHITCEVSGETKVLRKTATGTIELVDEATAATTPDDANILLGEKMGIPALATPGEFYTIGKDNYYLYDGFGNDYDALPGRLPEVKGETRVVTDDFLWTFTKQGDGYVLQNRNGNYLTWGADGTFDVNDVNTEAAILSLTYSVTEANGVWSVGNAQLTAQGGTGLIAGEEGYHFAFVSDKADLSDTKTDLSIVPYIIYPAEDYTAYSILPKTSWFIKLAEKQRETSKSFIQAGAGKEYGLQDFELKDDTGNLTGTTIKRQRTNDYRVVRYMKRNTTRELRLPSARYASGGDKSRICAYHRWYNYNTDGPIREDLIKLNQQSRRNYRNGTVMGSLMPLNGQTGGTFTEFGFNFKMPDDAPEDFEYTVGLDMSFYTDFVHEVCNRKRLWLLHHCPHHLLRLEQQGPLLPRAQALSRCLSR